MPTSSMQMIPVAGVPLAASQMLPADWPSLQPGRQGI